MFASKAQIAICTLPGYGLYKVPLRDETRNKRSLQLTWQKRIFNCTVLIPLKEASYRHHCCARCLFLFAVAANDGYRQ